MEDRIRSGSNEVEGEGKSLGRAGILMMSLVRAIFNAAADQDKQLELDRLGLATLDTLEGYIVTVITCHKRTVIIKT